MGADLMEESFSKEKGGAREDMISKLPDSLISQILSYLQTKEAVKTSVLSKRWRSLWLLIPKLDLESSEFPDYSAFVSFMDRFLDAAREEKSCLHKLKLSIRKDETDESCVTRWVDFAATPKLKHLDIEFGPVKPECLEVIPVSLYICETLLHLRLHRVSLVKFECGSSLPCLKTMRLEQNLYANETGLESLISSCPVLEDLTIVIRSYDDVKVLRVHSQTLTRLSIKHGYHDYKIEGFVEDYDGEDSGVLIDAPRLKYLDLEVCIFEFKTMSKWVSLTKLNVGGYFVLNDDEARNFVNCISGVVDMKISEENLEFIIDALPFSPQFCNLSCLEVKLHLWSVEDLPIFLEYFPNLKSLILDLYYSSMVEETRLVCTSVFANITRVCRDTEWKAY